MMKAVTRQALLRDSFGLSSDLFLESSVRNLTLHSTEEGNLRIYDCKMSGFGEPDANGIKTRYQECLFAVTPEELERYTLCGDFTVSGLHVTGHWSVTFPLEPTE